MLARSIHASLVSSQIVGNKWRIVSSSSSLLFSFREKDFDSLVEIAESEVIRTLSSVCSFVFDGEYEETFRAADEGRSA